MLKTAAYDTLKPMDISNWKTELQSTVDKPTELLHLLGLSGEETVLTDEEVRQFPVKVPVSFLTRINKNDPADPLLLQFLPRVEEDNARSDFSRDPLNELTKQSVPGLLHKYQGRVLLVTTGACAIHCRYCFRRHFPYTEENPAQNNWDGALKYMREDTTLHEVILSGGDPLSLSDDKLANLIDKLEGIPHLDRLRIHTRFPIIIPSRLTSALIAKLANTRLNSVVVVHSNHAKELDDTVSDALHKIRESGITLLNQSVLLKGINDHPDRLIDLSERLFECGVLPYYLHMLDPVQGAGHFHVSDAKAKTLLQSISSRLPGYLVPRLVRERPGTPYKISIY